MSKEQRNTAPEAITSQLIDSKALGRMLSPVRNYLFLASLLSFLGSAAGLVPYVAVAEIARLVLRNSGDTQTIWQWVGIAVACTLIRLALLLFSSQLGHVADAEILHKTRVRIVRHLGAMPLGWFRAKGSGIVKKVMTTDLEEMHQLIAHALREMIGAVTVIAIAIAYLATVSLQMTIVSCYVLLILYIAFKVSMRSATAHMNRLLEAEAKISTSAVEYADGISVVKTFGGGGKLLSRFNAAVKEHVSSLQVWVSETRYSSAIARVFASEVTLLAVLVITGMVLVGSGSLAVTDFLPFLIVGVGLPTAIVPAVHGSQGLRKGRLSASSIENVLSQEIIPEPARPQEPPQFDIAFRQVSFAYPGGNDVIRDISFECRQGTVTALVGPSGSGKSTIAHLLPRFYDVRKGSITIGGIDIRDISSKKLLSSMSLVFQDVVLLNDTIRENIRICNPDATEEAVMQAAKAAYIHDVIAQLPLGYDTILGTGSSGLSGGERQRLTIARAILSDAPIVVLDEATASLDPDNELLVQKALTALLKNKTVIMIAHRLYTIRNAHQIIVLKEGEIAERGTHQQLLNNRSMYAKMWEAQTTR